MSWHSIKSLLNELDLWDEGMPLQGVDFRRQKQHNWDALRKWGRGFGDRIDDYFSNVDQRIDDQLNANTMKDEEIDFRHSDMLSKTFETMRKRGDFYDEDLQQHGINVRWFGAIGDGKNDDTDAFKAAIAYASSLTDYIYIPLGIYAISSEIDLTKNIKSELGAQIICTTPGLEYLFNVTQDQQSKLIVDGLSIDMKKGRGMFNCNGLQYVRFSNCDFTGYDAESGYYQTDSGIMLANVVETYIKNVRFHDHGAQYSATDGKLNRCITLQGDANKLARFDEVNIERANQGIIADCANLTMTINDSYITETHDNSLYLLHLSLFSASNVVFDDKFDESCVIGNGTFMFNNCTYKDCPGRIIALNSDTISLSVTNCTFLQEDGYGGLPVVFRDITYRLNSFIFKDNRLNLNPADDKSDIFTFGQMDFFDIDNNVVKVASMGSYQRLFAFRNIDNITLKGKIVNNAILPLNSAESISEEYYFADFFKENNDVYISDNITSNGRFSLNHEGITINNQRVNGKTGPYAMGLDKIKSHLSSDYYPTTGTWQAGTIIWNQLANAENKTLCWLRVTDGEQNVLGTDWVAVKGQQKQKIYENMKKLKE